MSDEIQKTVLTEENQHVQQHPLAELEKTEIPTVNYQKLWVEAYGDCV